MSHYDLDRTRPDRIELWRIARIIDSGSIVDLTGIVFGQKCTRKNRIESEVHPTWTRHTSQRISRIGSVGIVLICRNYLRKDDARRRRNDTSARCSRALSF
jgi:hypothetical protein